MKTQIIVAFLAALVAVSYSTPIEGENYASKLELAEKYAKLIEKEGVKAWHFIECMGEDWALHCVANTLTCLAAKNLESCVELIVCEGKSAKTCAPKFK